MSIDSLTHSPDADDAIRRDLQRRNRAAIELLDAWEREGNESEQRESLALIKQALDEDRPGQRKHFP